MPIKKVVALYGLFCEECSAVLWPVGAGTASEARRRARAQGWRAPHNNPKNPTVLCPRHYRNRDDHVEGDT